MQVLQTAVRSGYYWVNFGRVRAEKLVDFVERIEKRLNLRRSRQAVSAARKKGQAVARLIIYPSNEETHPEFFDWWIVATDPSVEGADSAQHYSDVRNRQKRIIFGDQYELVEISITPPKPRDETQKSKKARKASLRWTWRMTGNYRSMVENTINRSASQKRVDQLRQLIQSVGKMPSFSGVRIDRAAIFIKIASAWKAAHCKGETSPELIFPKNYFKRSVKVKTVMRLGKFVSQMMDNERSSSYQLHLYIKNLRE